MNNGDCYQRGTVWLEDNRLALPHQCNEWVIGTPENVAMLIEDIHVLLAGEGIPCRGVWGESGILGDPDPCPRTTIAGYCGDHSP